MISEQPSLLARTPAGRRATGIGPVIERYTTDFAFYGSGKAALYDGLAGLVSPGENVLVPAYLPDAVVEPFRDLALEPRYYRVRETLAPNRADLVERLDDETAAVVTVDYFGFPQSGLEAVASLLDDRDCYHVDDNAHAPISVDNGTLLGTRGHLGITSLRKLLPIPDGAVLYCNDESVAARLEPSSFAGVRDELGVDDCRHVLESVAGDLLEANATVRRTVERLIAERSASVPDPKARYEAGKTPMSRVSAAVVDAADPTAIRRARRTNYLAWRRCFDSRSGVEIYHETLPEGICPQVFPLRTDSPQRLVAALERCGVAAHTWPRLAATVRDDPAYAVARRLARETVALPVHQGVDPAAIEAVADRLRW
ncbi:DegT/DnrJ/EryC1/StrS aminotransferase [Haloterrigena salina JCM 13891]|uniref:DegT/DnrJ/EryC1/StrS aminotransferase n=1 Tax=Haloterrigena salina JCM 13891 TaxID=1227488 RepID=M0C0A7_9EURY|nr:DegT/DnrJ/EryC1/StrS family aminotransferase [Haloterrigena salina]ELZ16088.1 DegT/DnrJ/EryC1/StrS aminotransferase [Haloterrigena salina JCM 13891]